MHGKVEACPALVGVLVETTGVGWLLATPPESRAFILLLPVDGAQEAPSDFLERTPEWVWKELKTVVLS